MRKLLKILRSGCGSKQTFSMSEQEGIAFNPIGQPVDLIRVLSLMFYGVHTKDLLVFNLFGFAFSCLRGL